MKDVKFANLDARAIEREILSGFERAAMEAGISDYKLYEGDPRRFFLLSVAAVIAQQNAVIDLTGKGNLLRYAQEDTIEDIGYLYGKRGARLQPSRAMTTLEYTLSAARNQTTLIPKGSRSSPDGEIYFATLADLFIPPGQLSGQVSAACYDVGEVGNGYEAGSISTIVDRNPFVAGVNNITESAGGADLEGLEAYRARIYQTPESFSVAGPQGAYEFWAKTASPAICDVAVWSPSPGVVHIAPLLFGGFIPNADLLRQVLEICNDRSVRPLTDKVEVFEPTAVEYEIVATYYIDRANMGEFTDICAAAENAAEVYRAWQSQKLGRDIVPSKLIELVMGAGVKRIVVESPEYRVLQPNEVASCALIDLKYGGFEDA